MRELYRRADRETPIFGLLEAEQNQLCATDVLEYRVAVKDERLAEGLAALPNQKRDVILLSYFLDMTDAEIAQRFRVVRTTIQRRRTNSLKELKSRLEVQEDAGYQVNHQHPQI